MRHSLRRTVISSMVAVVVLVMSIAGDVTADPAADALAKLNELSRQALDGRNAVTLAQRDVDATLAAQNSAEDRRRADLAALDAANVELAPYQAAVDQIAAMTYAMGGASQWEAVLTASSPQQLIDQLSLRREVAALKADQLKAFKVVRERAAEAARASETSANDARAAAERSAAVRAELQTKSIELQRQMLAAEAQYASLSPGQQAVVDLAAALPPPGAGAPGPVDPPILAVPGDISEALPVGVANEAGLQANTIVAARAISAQFPQIAAIDGVRPDSKPWHPSGLAIDVMIPNSSSPEGIALGDAILAYVLSNAGRFGLQDAIWRNTYYTPSGPQSSGYGHYDHVHVTTTPRR